MFDVEQDEVVVKDISLGEENMIRDTHGGGRPAIYNTRTQT